MNPFAITSDAERTALLLTLFLALLMLLALLFVTCNNKTKRTLKTVNVGLFLGFFMMLIILCTEHGYIADGFPLIFHSAIPVWRFWCAVIALFLYAAYGIASELIRRSKSIDRNSIKEALDTLPAAVCYFTENGLVKLCNLQMYRLFFALSQNDLQSLDELHVALGSCDSRTGAVRLSEEESVFLFPDGKAWLFTEEKVGLADGGSCTEVAFYDVTELYGKRLEVEAQTKKLRELGRSIKMLCENVVAATKEEEMLLFKTTLHDRMGAGLVAARQVLLQNRPTSEIEALMYDWKHSVSLVKQDNVSDRGELFELLRDAAAIGVDIRIDGELPPGGDTLDVFLNAIRECLTNCVRHADGTELYVKVCRDTSDDILTVSNNGKPPQTEIIPRGGLSNLMKRIGYLGGFAQIQSFPQFMLTVAIPKNRGILH